MSPKTRSYRQKEIDSLHDAPNDDSPKLQIRRGGLATKWLNITLGELDEIKEVLCFGTSPISKNKLCGIIEDLETYLKNVQKIKNTL